MITVERLDNRPGRLVSYTYVIRWPTIGFELRQDAYEGLPRL